MSGLPSTVAAAAADDAAADARDVAAVLAGDRGAYGGLVRRHQDFLFRFCLSMLRNEADAEDAAQEVLLKGFRSLARYRGEARFRTWLASIAANHCRDRLRRRRRRRTESLDALLARPGGREALLTDPAASPEDRLLFYQLSDHVLAVLSAKQRTALSLVEAVGFSYAEAATAMGTSEGSVKSLIWRARRRLQKRFPELGE